MHNRVGKKFQSINQGALGHVQTAVHPQGNRNWVNGELPLAQPLLAVGQCYTFPAESKQNEVIT